MKYAVVGIISGDIRYKGNFESRAADALNPGTCWGSGHSLENAVKDAMQKRAVFAARAMPQKRGDLR